MRFDDIYPRDASQLAMWLGDFCPTFFLIDGYIFLDRDKVGEKKLRLEIAESPSIKEAQFEMNIIPLSDFVEQFTTTEDPDDPGVKRILAICEDNWTIRIKAAFPKVEFKIVHWSNDDAGEYGLRLTNDSNYRPAASKS